MINDRFFWKILKESDCKFRENFDLTATSSARIPTVAKAVTFPESEEKLIELLHTLEEYDIQYIVIGGMSNLLVKNGIFNGVVVKTDKIRTKSVAENRITLGCGIRLGGIIREAACDNLGGMEGLCGVPGTVGGMVKQNAGAFGYEISDRFVNASCYFPTDGKTRLISKENMRFAYRESILSDKRSVLLSATFELIPKSREEIFAEINHFRDLRVNTQPLNFPSFGSIFKRCNGTSAGYFIDKAGLKGATIGGATVSKKHAGFIVNKGGATADDFLKLIYYVKDSVYSAFGVELTEEIEII